jgi:hypothetical protein
MEKELQDRIESSKSDGKRKKGCTSCKQKKHEVILEPVKEEEVWIPTQEEIKLAYAELTSYGGVKQDKKEFINKIYKYIFNEGFDWNCRDCVNNQARRFRIYMTGK